jgi:hypothetical protein
MVTPDWSLATALNCVDSLKYTLATVGDMEILSTSDTPFEDAGSSLQAEINNIPGTIIDIIIEGNVTFMINPVLFPLINLFCFINKIKQQSAGKYYFFHKSAGHFRLRLIS